MKRAPTIFAVILTLLTCGWLYLRHLDERAAAFSIRSYTVEFEWRADRRTYTVLDGVTNALIRGGERHREGLREARHHTERLMADSALHAGKGLVTFSLMGSYDAPFPAGDSARVLEPDTALFLGYAERGDAAAVSRLLASGHEVDEREVPSRLSALMIAAIVDKDEVVDFLLKAGADPNGTDYAGKTALMWAAQANAVRSARLLLRAGADGYAHDYFGNTPVSLALDRRNRDVQAVLLGSGAKAPRMPGRFTTLP